MRRPAPARCRSPPQLVLDSKAIEQVEIHAILHSVAGLLAGDDVPDIGHQKDAFRHRSPLRCGIVFDPLRREHDVEVEGTVGGQVEGAADLVVEILGDSSVGKDTHRLPEAYAQAGVGELWLIDARRCGSGDEQPEFRLLTLQAGRFAAAAEIAGRPVSPSLGGTVRLTKTITQRGLPRYDLEIRDES